MLPYFSLLSKVAGHDANDARTRIDQSNLFNQLSKHFVDRPLYFVPGSENVPTMNKIPNNHRLICSDGGKMLCSKSSADASVDRVLGPGLSSGNSFRVFEGICNVQSSESVQNYGSQLHFGGGLLRCVTDQSKLPRFVSPNLNIPAVNLNVPTVNLNIPAVNLNIPAVCYNGLTLDARSLLVGQPYYQPKPVSNTLMVSRGYSSCHPDWIDRFASFAGSRVPAAGSESPQRPLSLKNCSNDPTPAPSLQADSSCGKKVLFEPLCKFLSPALSKNRPKAMPDVCLEKTSVLENPRHFVEDSRELVEDRKYSCHLCYRAFTRSSYLNQHVLAHSDKHSVCTICNKRFSTRNNLKRHMVLHSVNNPFRCDLCGTRFTDKYNLKRHRLLHSNHKPFACTCCQRCFHAGFYLRRHMQKHSSRSPIVCKVCHQRFSRRDVLKQHMFIHSGKRPHGCTICSRGFTRKYDLRRHMKRVHGRSESDAVDLTTSTSNAWRPGSSNSVTKKRVSPASQQLKRRRRCLETSQAIFITTHNFGECFWPVASFWDIFLTPVELDSCFQCPGPFWMSMPRPFWMKSRWLLFFSHVRAFHESSSAWFSFVAQIFAAQCGGRITLLHWLRDRKCDLVIRIFAHNVDLPFQKSISLFACLSEWTSGGTLPSVLYRPTIFFRKNFETVLLICQLNFLKKCSKFYFFYRLKPFNEPRFWCILFVNFHVIREI